MYYRMRIYRCVASNLDAFHNFFRIHLMPVQVRHGARLVGRWVAEDDRVVVIWEYHNRDHYEEVHGAVRIDPDAIAAQEYRRKHLPQLYYEMEEVFMTAVP